MTKKYEERIGILGGTFDPVHNGHIGLAAQALEKLQLSRVLFIPAFQPPHKQNHPLTSAEHRLAMLQLAIASNPDFAVSDIELKRQGISYTIETIKSFQSAHPGREYFLIMGTDMFKELNTWKNFRELVKLCHILVGSRPGYILNRPEKFLQSFFPESAEVYIPGKVEEKSQGFVHRESGTNLTFFEIIPLEISSSQIREKIARNLNIKNLLPPEVENYIIEHHLYRARSHPDQS